LADLGQQQHIRSTTAFEQWFIHRWDSTSSADGELKLFKDVWKPVSAALACALQLLAAAEPSALLQQVRGSIIWQFFHIRAATALLYSITLPY
jgi:hypothetical protein